MATGVVVLMTVEELHFVTSVYVMMQVRTAARGWDGQGIAA